MKNSFRALPLADDTSGTRHSRPPFFDHALFLVFVVERTAHRTYAVEIKIRIVGCPSMLA
jgi:hypothetical protein